MDQIKTPVDFIVISRPVASCLGHGRYVMRDDEAKVAAHSQKDDYSFFGIRRTIQHEDR